MNTPLTSPYPSALFRIACHVARHRQRGLTLVELLIAMAIIAVLASIAVPSMSAMIASIKLSSASSVFVSGFNLARSEAIKRGARVVLCKSADGQTCAADGGWEQGWIVFHDANSDGARNASEKLLLRELPLSAGLKFSGNLNVARYVAFAPSGIPSLTGGGFQAGTLTVCRLSLVQGEARQIVLNSVGRPKVHKSTVSSCY